MYIDTHCHLTDNKYDNIDLILDESKKVGVKNFITASVDLKSSLTSVKFANCHEGVYSSIGIYPENVKDFSENILENLAELSKNSKVVAIGEIGLDYNQTFSDKYIQKDVLVKQIHFAYELGLPIVFHCREAYGDLLNILKSEKNYLKFGGTCHCFNGSKEIAKEILKLDLHISVGGVSTFKNAENIRQMLKTIPLEKIILETDSPYLTPHPYRSKINSPMYIPLIANNLANILNTSIDEIELNTTKNAKRLFNI